MCPALFLQRESRLPAEDDARGDAGIVLPRPIGSDYFLKSRHEIFSLNEPDAEVLAEVEVHPTAGSHRERIRGSGTGDGAGAVVRAPE